MTETTDTSTRRSQSVKDFFSNADRTAVIPATTADLRQLATRYLGADEADAFVTRLAGGGATASDIVVRLRPERWLTLDEAPAE